MKKVGVKPTEKGVGKALDQQVSKSQKIRELFDMGVTVADISKLMGIRYQFANNIIQQHVLKEGIKVEYDKRGRSAVVVAEAK
jgi:hypothetical protein